MPHNLLRTETDLSESPIKLLGEERVPQEPVLGPLLVLIYRVYCNSSNSFSELLVKDDGMGWGGEG